MRMRSVALYAVAAMLAIFAGLGIGYWALVRSTAAPKTTALLLQSPRKLPPFSLENAVQAPFGNAQLQGHWSLLYFGYSNCKDVCPTTLADLSRMTALLKNLPSSQRPRVYFISVDPKRDTPARLRSYVHNFNPDFVGVTGSVASLHTLTDPLGVAFSYDPPDRLGHYDVQHSVAVFLINPRGQETAIYTSPMTPGRMASDYRAIVGYFGDR
jgi:protein SCO1